MLAATSQHISLFSSGPSIARTLARAREAQTDWATTSVRARLERVRTFRGLLAERCNQLAATVQLPERRFSTETLSAEVQPLANACRFLERHARSTLASRRLGSWRARLPGGLATTIERRPLGVVLVICAGNYPIFLPGVQIVQALVAGNAVVVKPAPGTEAVLQLLVELLIEAGFDANLLVLLDTPHEIVDKVLAEGIDKILFTGASASGRLLLSKAAPTLTPATLELSGCDAVFIHPDADLDLVVDALIFGLSFNSSATCIAPRRVFVPRSRAEELEAKLVDTLRLVPPVTLPTERARLAGELSAKAIHQGARLIFPTTSEELLTGPVVLSDVDPGMDIARSDLFAPVLSILPVGDFGEALHLDRQCPYSLGASVFGPSRAAVRWSEQIDVGVVAINDIIAPTADPGVPFGGRGESGFGVTRGREGLLELTRPRAVVRRGGRWRPHFRPLQPVDEHLISAWVRARHSRSWQGRWRGWADIVRALANSR